MNAVRVELIRFPQGARINKRLKINVLKRWPSWETCLFTYEIGLENEAIQTGLGFHWVWSAGSEMVQQWLHCWIDVLGHTGRPLLHPVTHLNWWLCMLGSTRIPFLTYSHTPCGDRAVLEVPFYRNYLIKLQMQPNMKISDAPKQFHCSSWNFIK